MWTQDAYALVEREWANGLSAKQVSVKLARELGIRKTRNAVIGIIHRHGFARRVDVHSTNRVRIDRVRRVRLAAKCVVQPKVRPSRAPVLPEDRAAAKALPMLGPIVTELGPRCCHYIAGDPAIDARACGRATEAGRVYCADHMKLCYEPAPKKREPKRKEPVSRTLDQSRWIWGAA